MGKGKIRVGVKSSNAKAQTELDRYIAQLRRHGEELMVALSEEGAKKAIEYAPLGKKPDKRTRPLKDSIHAEHGKTYARWVVNARHGKIIEEGGGPSEITGRVYFFWERHNRFWRPGDNIIHHPPTAAKPYMRPSLHAIMKEWPEIAKRIYPQ